MGGSIRLCGITNTEKSGGRRETCYYSRLQMAENEEDYEKGTQKNFRWRNAFERR